MPACIVTFVLVGLSKLEWLEINLYPISKILNFSEVFLILMSNGTQYDVPASIHSAAD